MPFESFVRTIPDYPQPGIQFRDVTPLLLDAGGFGQTIEAMAAPFDDAGVDKVAAIEARGFILGGAIAERLGAGFIPVRKKGKLPHDTIGVDYALEYGTDRVEIHRDAVLTGERVLLVDDLIATGGTALAAIRLIEQLGGILVAVSTIVDLPDVGGSAAIRQLGHRVEVLCAFEGE